MKPASRRGRFAELIQMLSETRATSLRFSASDVYPAQSVWLNFTKNIGGA